MTDDRFLQDLFDSDTDGSVPDLTKLRQRFVDYIDTGGSDGPDSGDDGPNPTNDGPDGNNGDSPGSSDGPRTSGPSEAISSTNPQDGSNTRSDAEGHTVTNSDDDGYADVGDREVYEAGGGRQGLINRMRIMQGLSIQVPGVTYNQDGFTDAEFEAIKRSTKAKLDEYEKEHPDETNAERDERQGDLRQEQNEAGPGAIPDFDDGQSDFDDGYADVGNRELYEASGGRQGLINRMRIMKGLSIQVPGVTYNQDGFTDAEFAEIMRSTKAKLDEYEKEHPDETNTKHDDDPGQSDYEAGPGLRRRTQIHRELTHQIPFEVLDELHIGEPEPRPLWQRLEFIGPIVLGVVAVVIVIIFGGGGDDPTAEPPTQAEVTAPIDDDPGSEAPTQVEPTAPIEDEDPPAPDPDPEPGSGQPTQLEPTVPVEDEAPPPPDDPPPPPTGGVILPQPLFIVLSDSSQYAVWALEDDLGTITYALRSPARESGCLIISYGPGDADTFGSCQIPQIGTAQVATVLSTAANGAVLLELRSAEVVNLTDETGFAQSAIVNVVDAPVVRHAGDLVFGDEQHTLGG